MFCKQFKFTDRNIKGTNFLKIDIYFIGNGCVKTLTLTIKQHTSHVFKPRVGGHRTDYPAMGKIMK